MGKLRSKLEQNLGWAVLLLLLAGCLLVLRPFVSALLWAVVLCFSSWPLYQRLLRWVGHRRTLAALTMALGMVLILLVPFVVIGTTLADNVKELTLATRHWLQAGPPAPPAWLVKVPVLGAPAAERWQALTTDTTRLWTEARRFIEPVSAWLLKVGLALGSGLLQLALSILITFFLFRDGASAAERLTHLVERIGGEQGQHLLTVAGNTIRGVVYGILGTALVQAILAGIGFLIAGVPGPGLLALLTFFVSVVPAMGVALVWLPAAIWLFCQGATGWGIFMIVWGLGVNNIEHVIKPWIISQGSHMPFLLIFFGVIGGALTFGFIGIFLGPTLLAVGFRLIEEWGAAHPVAPAANASPPAALTEEQPAALK
ncbi:MAG TPA: AI-2E family transporter [Bacillota bacterium]|nr:AI-2E family transporter [Bacillota bacterium]